MRTLLLLAAVSIAAGCASWPAYRFVEVATSHTEVNSTNGMTSTDAERVLRDVADRLRFVVKGPIRVTNSQFEFSAREPGKTPKDPTHIGLNVDEKRISFFADIYGTTRDLQAAEGIAALFQEELDKRAIHYTVKKGKSSLFAP